MTSSNGNTPMHGNQIAAARSSDKITTALPTRFRKLEPARFP
jgi:hypothetical protein